MVNEGDAHNSSIYFSENDKNSSLYVQYILSTSEHAIDFFDSKNITGIDNRSEDASLNKSDDANNILQDSDLYLLDMISSLHKVESSSDIMSPPSMSASTAGLINTLRNIAMVGSTQTSIGRSSDDSLETTIEPSSINGRLKGYYCSGVVFNLSNKVLSDTEINVLGKGLGFTSAPSFINESDLKRDFEDFARKMRCKWYFRNDITENFSQLPVFQNKSNWNPPKRHPALEMFLS